MEPVVIEKHKDVYVVRDDLLPGGTKGRYLLHLFQKYDEVVYATPAYGGAQLALAYCAKMTGKRATLFVAKRKDPHKRTLEAHKAGARVFQVPYGYLNNIQSKAKKYAKDHGAYYLEFGGNHPQTIEIIAQAGRLAQKQIGPIDEVWSACGSGVLMTGLKKGIKADRYNGVQVGAEVKNLHGVKLYKHKLKFQDEIKIVTPFPSCKNYDAKAWELCQQYKRGKNVLFWNVLGESFTPYYYKI